ncbi:MAG TPA: phosphatase domain-containing protein [Pirellulales bacterium]|nr:phosphatase domain-containing protein [Pirellulales bacterium]
MRAFGALMLFASAMAAAPPASAAGLEGDVDVQFFPTSARFVPERNEWLLPVHAWVYSPAEDSAVRALALDGLRRLLDLEPTPDQAPLFKERAWPFVVDNLADREITLQMGGQYFFLERTAENGHASGELRLPAETAAALSKTPAADGRWLIYSALTDDAGDDRLLTGKVELLENRGVSVVSDIDDTIRVSLVGNRRALLESTFLRRFEAVPGMARLYRRWADAGAAFHYVSAGPWQLYAPLEQFRIAEEFPAGSFAMQLFRWKDRSALAFFGKPDEAKRPAIEALLAAYPERRLICVGDSGERDPELYADLARRYPGRIMRIFIRNVSREASDGERFRAAFRELPCTLWRVFDDPRELAEFTFEP